MFGYGKDMSSWPRFIPQKMGRNDNGATFDHFCPPVADWWLFLAENIIRSFSDLLLVICSFKRPFFICLLVCGCFKRFVSAFYQFFNRLSRGNVLTSRPLRKESACTCQTRSGPDRSYVGLKNMGRLVAASRFTWLSLHMSFGWNISKKGKKTLMTPKDNVLEGRTSSKRKLLEF